MTPNVPRRISPDIVGRLAEIDTHVERIAIAAQDGSHVEMLAYAIHNLIGCIREMEADGSVDETSE